MEQKDKQFDPHVLAIQAGAAVSFPNLDPIFHSAFSNFSGQVFDLGLYAPGSSRNIVFRRTGVVRIFCNIHPSMSAIIVVLKCPWFAVSDAMRANTRSPVCRPANTPSTSSTSGRRSETLQALERRVVVAESNLELPALAISETGYLEPPHKNKYGQDYPPGCPWGRVVPDKPAMKARSVRNFAALEDHAVHLRRHHGGVRGDRLDGGA